MKYFDRADLNTFTYFKKFQKLQLVQDNLYFKIS